MDHSMESATTMFDHLASPHDETFSFGPFTADAFMNENVSPALSAASAHGSPLTQHNFTTIPFAMPFNAADHYSSSNTAGGLTPQNDMAGMIVNQFSSPHLLQSQLPSHGRHNQGSISSLASSATAVSYSDEHVEIKEEMSPFSTESPVTEIPFIHGGSADAATSQNAAAAVTPAKAPAKRKRENRYKNAPPAVLSRRRAQNRASQRAYRERKDQRIRDLEEQLHHLRAEHESCKSHMNSMHNHMIALRMQYSHTAAAPSACGTGYAAPSMAGPPMAVANPAMVTMVPGGPQMDPSMYQQVPPNFNIPPQEMVPPPQVATGFSHM
ncbi:hypothetical protein SEPCBS119000_005047 [Sporothrix epigloea]|uniref:Putative transcription factor kapC n=1 Tax=Sporothrix epigloea TaxID=1892477 RepID=A0ABP0DXC1_9PEZI